MKIARIIMLALLLGLTATALAEDTKTGVITLRGNNSKLEVQAQVEPNEGTLHANDDLSGEKLKGVAGTSGELLVDCRTADDRPTMLILPLWMIADTKESDTDTQLNAWTEMGHSAVMFDNEYMKSIYSTAVRVFLEDQVKTTLRAVVGSLWDDSAHEDGSWMKGKEEALKNSDIELIIGLMPMSVSASRASQTVNGLPVIGSVYVTIGVGGSAVKSSSMPRVRTQFTLPAGGVPSGVRVLHKDGNKMTQVPCSVSGSDVYFDTNRQGEFYVVYDAEGAQISVPETGDDSYAILWIGLFMLSAAGFAVSGAASRRWRKTR